MRKLLSALAICALAWLSGCILALHPTVPAELSDRDVTFIADTIAALAVDRIAPGERIALTGPAGEGGDSRLDAGIRAAIERRGFVLQENATSTEVFHALRYWLTSYGRSYLLHVTVDGTEVSCLLARGQSGELKAEAPLSVREAIR
jgi:hypothetical protein